MRNIDSAVIRELKAYQGQCKLFKEHLEYITIFIIQADHARSQNF